MRWKMSGWEVATLALLAAGVIALVIAAQVGVQIQALDVELHRIASVNVPGAGKAPDLGTSLYLNMGIDEVQIIARVAALRVYGMMLVVAGFVALIAAGFCVWEERLRAKVAEPNPVQSEP